MDKEQDKLIDRIKKLLALANHPGTNEHEAALAASRVQDLLTEHNLSMAQVDGASRREQSERGKTFHTKSAMYRYQQDLMSALAKNNFCMWWMDRTAKRDPRGKPTYFADTKTWEKGRTVLTHVLIGRLVNVEMTRLTYDYLVETMDRILPYEGMEKRGKDALLWLGGCAERLVELLKEKREEAEKESTQKAKEEKVRQAHPGAARTANALVVLSQVYGSEEEENDDFMHGRPPGTTARARIAREVEQRAQQELIDAEHARLLASGVSDDDAFYLARGWPLPDKIEVVTRTTKEETEAQRRKREAREERSRSGYYNREYRRQAREQERRSNPAYQAGKKAAAGIGLDTQVGESASKRRLR